MKKIFFCIVFLCSLTFSFAQTRNNNVATTLENKSKAISNAKYWYQENGKWKNRSCNKYTFESGVQSENFNTIFIGEMNSLKYLFIDYWKAKWEYPNLKLNWTYYRQLHSAIITENDYNALKNIQPNEIVNIISLFNFDMFKGNSSYSFPFFLDLMNTSYSSSQTLYNSYKKHEGEEYAKEKYKKENPPQYVFSAKRTFNNDKDVVRFSVFPVYLEFGKPALIDQFYFEVPYNEFMLLFEADKTTRYK